MKKALIGILFYFIILHVLIPIVFYLFKGDVIPVYSSFFYQESFIKAFFLIVFSFGISLSVLFLLPEGKVITPLINNTSITRLFYFSVLFKLFTFYLYGGYQGLLSGEAAGKINTYIAIFLNPFTLLLIVFFGQSKRSSLIMPVIFYILSATLSGSRSGILAVFFIFFIGYAYKSFIFYKVRLLRFLKYTFIFSPILYVLASQVRDSSLIDYSFLQYQIVGRMSTLETAMHPIYYKDNNLDLTLFNEKYGLINQFKLVLDSFIPGQIFEFDISPNNYYRSIFFDTSLTYVRENYMSINMTLPVYLYMKYGYFCIPLTVVYIFAFYILLIYLRRSPLISIALLSCFYNIIFYFDWVMTFTELYSALLTVLTVKFYLHIRRLLINSSSHIYL
jgi:hypothetical protein